MKLLCALHPTRSRGPSYWASAPCVAASSPACPTSQLWQEPTAATTSASIRLGVRSDPPGVRSDPRDGRPRAAGQHGGRMPSVPHVQHLAGKRMSSAFHWCTVHRCQTKIFVRGGRTNPTVPQNRIGIPTGKGDMVSFGGVTVEF